MRAERRPPTSSSDYFARVRPLLGEGLRASRVAAQDLAVTGRVLELLFGCMLRRIFWPGRPEPIEWPLAELFRSGPAGRNRPPSSRARRRGEGSAQQLLLDFFHWKNAFEPLEARPLARQRPELRLRGRCLPPGQPPRAHWDEGQRTVTLEVSRGDFFGWLDLSSAVAWQAREILLGRRPWSSGTVHHGSAAWPWSRTPLPLPAEAPRALALEGVHLLLIGCGSVGSEAARLLAGHGARWTLVDPGRVSPFNPSRQWFGSSEIGAAKVTALERRLRPERARGWQQELGAGSLPDLRRLLLEDRPDAALLATGTADQGPLAELLWAEKVPHLCACAYPRARFFEVGLVLPGEGTGCLHCYRDQLLTGPSAPPLDDELAHFLYRELTEVERARAYRDLVAEPATCVETGRVAEVSARALSELLRPPADRAGWFRRLLAEQTTWLLGSNVEEPNPYGLSFAGQVVRLGEGDLISFDEERVCRGCGREQRVSSPARLPRADSSTIDAALLSR